MPNRVYVVRRTRRWSWWTDICTSAGGPRIAASTTPSISSFDRSRARWGACDRSRAFGHGVGRRPGYSRDQVDGRDHVRAGSGDGKIRRHAAGRHRDADGRLRRVARRDRRKVALLSKHPYLAPPFAPERGASDHRRAASPHLPAAAAGVRRQFLALQDPDHHPPAVPAHGPAPHGRGRTPISRTWSRRRGGPQSP